MPVKGSTISYEDLGKILAEIPAAELNKTKLFLEGDHWQGQEGWIGWRPPIGGDKSLTDWQLIERGFTPKNVIKGMVWRLRGAIFGKEPDWEIVSADHDPNEMDPEKIQASQESPETQRWREVDAIATKWWTDKQVHRVMKQFITHYAAYGKASIRIYIPSGYLKKGANGQYTLQFKDSSKLEDILANIYVDAPEFQNINNAPDDMFGKEFVVLKFIKDEGVTATGDDVYEVHYIDEDGKTHIRHVAQAGDKTSETTGEISVDLGGNLLTYVVGEFAEAMISLPVKAQQRQLNHAKTMEGYALANINFPETIFINANLETEKKKGPDGTDVDTAKPLWRGAGYWLNLIGVPMTRADGSEQLATPDVKYKTPADPEKFAKVAENNTRDMHQEAGMLYVMLSSSPYPSGDSRVEAMTDYLILLVDYKTLADTMGVWLLTTVLRLAFNFSNQTQDNDKFSVIFSTKLTIGQVSPEDKTIMLAEVAAKVRSMRNYMITAGVSDDPSIELNVIANQPEMVDPNAQSANPDDPAAQKANPKPAQK